MASRPAGDQSVLDTNPHLAHYVFKMLATSVATRNASGQQHPLSVSSSGESDSEEDEHRRHNDSHSEQNDAASSADEDGLPKAPRSNTSSNGNRATGSTREDKEDIVRKIIDLLDNEQEEDVKDLLRSPMGDLGKDELIMDQVCLDCMHRHRDDLSGVPYQAGTFTPTRIRRPYTPTGVGTLRVRTPLARPHSPAGSGAATPTSTHGPSALGRTESTSSAPGSPATSPRQALNVKAPTFNPTGGPAARALSNMSTGFTPSADPWRDAESIPRAGSPYAFGAGQSMVRTGSGRVLAAPIISDPSSPFHSPLGTPTRTPAKLAGDVFSSPAKTARPASRGVVPDEEDDEEFSPFGSSLPKINRPAESPGLNSHAKPFEPTFGGTSDFHPTGSPLATPYGSQVSSSYESRSSADTDDDPNAPPSGMTPLDVLSSVFSTVPRVQLEDALHRAGYDFEAAMAMLVAQFAHPRSGASTPQRINSPRPLIGVDGRGGSQHAPGPGYFQQGGRGLGPNMNSGMGGPRSAGPTRMCRYFLNGECRRSDCRFSHDLDRALCRFWLRGHCAKGPSCEFMHSLPNNMDPHQLNSSMARVNLDSPGGSMPGTPPIQGHYGANHHGGGGGDEFPDLLAARLNRHVGRFDPARNRFANAVKRPAPAPPPTGIIHVSGAQPRMVSGPSALGGDRTPNAPPAPVPIVPRPSNRVKLHAATLMPTLATGTAANEQYMTARNASIRLGHARNACLARAADAFRRGDGAAAKRFSREGKALNEKMLHESAEAANALVKERMHDAQRAVRERDPAWSDDPRDRSERGKECGSGLGVILGVAGASKVPGGERLSSDERTECLLDLHTLHGSEGAELASHFLAELERENFRGLAYIVVGEEKHVGQQDPARGASKVRLGNSVKQFLSEWGYAWSENAGILCVDPCR